MPDTVKQAKSDSADERPGPSRFAAPGPGSWELEAGHHGARPLSGYLAETYRRAFESGMKVMVERYGLPLAGVRAEFVNGCLYLRPTGVGEGDKPMPTPPVWIMKIAVRLIPEMRRRNRTAVRAWADRRWRADVDQWFDHDRARVVAANLEFQAVELTALNDAELVAHVDAVHANFETQARANMANHGGDLIPIGDYLAHCQTWGVPFADAAGLLTGSSPGTVATVELLAPVATAIATTAHAPSSISEVRDLGPEAAAGVDAWLERHAWRLMTSDDIDRPTLAERPALQLAALLAAVDGSVAAQEPPDPADIRDRIPLAGRAQFDELLEEARYGLRQRDDVVGTRWNWSAGLLRRGLLEVGRRLADAGALQQADHAVELTPSEIEPLLISGVGPSAAVVAARAAERDRIEASDPPATLGDPEEPPPITAFPPAMARATAAMMTMLDADGTSPAPDPLRGTGVGSEIYRGTARVATTADDALDRLVPGDVLVARFTGPAYNSILPILGALVVETGGSLCHAAIVAREFGLPAVIGATGATTQIPDGATVEVDPVRGLVRIVN